MKKKYLIILFTVIAVLAFVLCFFCKPIYYCLYLGNRITGSVQLSVDGKLITLDENCFITVEDKHSVQQNGDALDIALRGGDYGNYGFEIEVPNFSEKIRVTIMQFNWWNVINFDIDIAIDTTNQNVTYTYFYATVAEDGKSLYESGTKTDCIGKDNLEIYIGGA